MAKVFLAAVMAAALACGAQVLAHAGDEVYAVPGWGVALTVVLVAVCVVGAGLVLRSGDAGFGLVSLGAAAFIAFGMLAVLSFGILALFVGVGLLIWAVRWSGPPIAAIGGATAGLALPILLAFAFTGPVVDCGPEGTGSGENIFMALSGIGGSGVSQGSAMDAHDGPETGSASGDGYEYTFTCENGRLTHFDLRWR